MLSSQTANSLVHAISIFHIFVICLIVPGILFLPVCIVMVAVKHRRSWWRPLRVMIAFIGGTAVSQIAFLSCPLTILQTSLLRLHDPRLPQPVSYLTGQFYYGHALWWQRITPLEVVACTVLDVLLIATAIVIAASWPTVKRPAPRHALTHAPDH